MTADRLRQASALLRERSEAATPGPWHVCERIEDHFDVFGADTIVCGPMHEPIANLSDEWYEPDHGEPTAGIDAAYIATMSPPVALALADWLDIHADYEDTGENARDEFLAALAVADAILGDAS